MEKKTFTGARAVCLGILAGFLMFSCTSYGIGGGYTSRTKKIEAADFADSNSSVYLSASSKYAETLIAFHKGTVSAEGGGVNETRDTGGFSTGVYYKLPFVINQFFSPLFLLGGEYQNFAKEADGVFWNQLDDYDTYIGDFSLKVGTGFDFSFSKSFYVRGRMYYAPPIIGGRSEFSFNLGLGYRTILDSAKSEWKTGAERTIARVNKEGQEALDSGDYGHAVSLYTRGIALQEDNYTYYYKRSEAHAGAGDYAAALDDFNRATRINPVLQGNTGYTTWKQLVADYEKASGQDAPMDDQGKLIVQSSLLKIASRDDSSRWKGNGNGISYPAGQYNLTFWYQNGAEKSGEAVFALKVEAGHVYYANAVKDKFTVTISIVDATDRELRGGTATRPVATKAVEIIVASFPSEMALPSWVQPGMTERQVRSRMGTAPSSTDDDYHVYITRTAAGKAIGYAFTFSESGNGLVTYSVMMETNLNAVLNNFRKTIDREPTTQKEGKNTTYSWVLPSQIRGDVLMLNVLDTGDQQIAIQYIFYNLWDN